MQKMHQGEQQMNETNEFKEIDLNQLQKVWVSDGPNGPWTIRYFIKKHKDSDSPYYAMDDEGSVFGWKYIRPYKEPTKRPMTDREIFNALKKEDCWLRWPENTENQFCTWHVQWIAEEYEITYDAGETWHKLEVEI